jgi:hypothetical protein
MAPTSVTSFSLSMALIALASFYSNTFWRGGKDVIALDAPWFNKDIGGSDALQSSRSRIYFEGVFMKSIFKNDQIV